MAITDTLSEYNFWVQITAGRRIAFPITSLSRSDAIGQSVDNSAIGSWVVT